VEVVGYARVSTDHQSLEAQRDALTPDPLLFLIADGVP